MLSVLLQVSCLLVDVRCGDAPGRAVCGVRRSRCSRHWATYALFDQFQCGYYVDSLDEYLVRDDQVYLAVTKSMR